MIYKNDHESLDDMRQQISTEILSSYELPIIRKKAIENLMRWKNGGVWCKAYEEWLRIIQDESDEKLRYMMTSGDDYAVQMRQSTPFVGLLPPKRIWELKNTVYQS